MKADDRCPDYQAMSEDFNLQRFLDAQHPVFEIVVRELFAGKKATHWTWFVFPQIRGLGHSSTSRFYAISNTEEAKAYIIHPILGNRLRECCEILLDLDGVTALDIFGDIDEQKLFASMTLFTGVTDDNKIFEAILDKYFGGRRHTRTLVLTGCPC